MPPQCDPKLQLMLCLQQQHRMRTLGINESALHKFTYTSNPLAASKFVNDGQEGFDFATYRREIAPHLSNDYKTSMCRSVQNKEPCPYGMACKFAHKLEELRLPDPRGKRHPKYKTKLCEKFAEIGICKYGDKCQFVHYQKSANYFNGKSSSSGSSTVSKESLDGIGKYGAIGENNVSRSTSTKLIPLNDSARFAGIEKTWTPFTLSNNRIWEPPIERYNASLPALQNAHQASRKDITQPEAAMFVGWAPIPAKFV